VYGLRLSDSNKETTLLYFTILKLMNRNVPVALLKVLINWYDKCVVFVRWNNECFYLMCGVRQGGVVSSPVFSVC